MTYTKKLTRSITDRKIGGVCGGLGVYFGIDPTVLRVIAILLCFITAVVPMTIAYLILCLVIPEE
jgi:phage shock protein C, pspC